MFKLIKDNNKKIADELAGTDKFWKKSASSIVLLKALNPLLKRYIKGKVLDAGAGRLAYKNLLLNYADSYESVDFKKINLNIDYIADLEKLPMPDGTYDSIFCSQVLEHVPNPDKALAELYRVLKKRGILILTVPHLGYLHNEPYDFYRYTKYGVLHLAKRNRFKIIELQSCGGLFTFNNYLISNLLMGLFYRFPIKNIIFHINYIIAKGFIVLDKIIPNKKIFYLYVVGIFKK